MGAPGQVGVTVAAGVLGMLDSAGHPGEPGQTGVTVATGTGTEEEALTIG